MALSARTGTVGGLRRRRVCAWRDVALPNSSRARWGSVAAGDRGGGNASAVLPKVSADALKEALEPVVETDIVPVSDADRAYPP